jgi:flagellar protein FliS
MTRTNHYQSMNVSTASPMDLVIMLYDECVKTLDRADAAFDLSGPASIEAISNHLLHAEDILTELTVSLDYEKGGDIATHLHRLYDFMIAHISEANVRKERNRIHEVRRMLLDLREAWVQVAKMENEQSQPAATSHPASMISVNG